MPVPPDRRAHRSLPGWARRLLALVAPPELRRDAGRELAEGYRRRRSRGRGGAELWLLRQLTSRDWWRLRRELRAGHRVPPGRRRWRGTVADLWRASRQELRASPGVTLAVVATLAVGIGATLTATATVRSLVLEPLPYRDPGRLVLLWHRLDASDARRVAVPALDVLDLRRRARTLDGIEAVAKSADAGLLLDDRAEHVRLGRVSPGLFELLGVRPALGRTLAPDDLPVVAEAEPDSEAADGPGARAGIPLLLGHDAWQRLWNGDPDVVGASVRLNGQPAVVVGVMPASFELLLPVAAGVPTDTDAWTPMPLRTGRGVRQDQRIRDQDSDDGVAVIARRGEGRGIEAVRREAAEIAAWQRARHPYHDRAGVRIFVEPLHAAVTEQAARLLPGILGFSVLVLVVACLNAALLLLARVSSRGGELAVRAALGAGRGRLLVGVLVQSGLMASAAAMVGLGLAGLSLELLRAHAPVGLPRLQSVSLDLLDFGLAAGLAVLAALVAGVSPAWHAVTRGSAAVLRSRHAGAGADAGARRWLVTAEAAVAFVLIAGAILLAQSLGAMSAVGAGFRPEGVLTAEIALRHPSRYRGPADRTEAIRGLQARLRELPRVQSVGVITGVPLGGRTSTVPWGREGESPELWSSRQAHYRVVDGALFAALGTRLLEGRTFASRDDRQDRRVAIVDRRLAERLAPAGSAVGARIGFPLDGDRVLAEVVGVVETLRHQALTRSGEETIYVPYRHEASRDVALVLRYRGEAVAAATGLRRAIAQYDPEIPVHDVATLESLVRASQRDVRAAMAVGVVMGLVSLALVAAGLFGVVAFTVARRRSEIGVRVAVGARPRQVVGPILGDALRMVLVGLAPGLVLASLLGRWLEGLLFRVSPLEPVALLVAAGVLGLVALTAAAWPARRAARLDPATALRGE